MNEIIAGRNLTEELNRVIGQREGHISFFVGLLNEDEELIQISAKGANEEHIGASMIKVLIMECLFREVELGHLSLDDQMDMAEVPRADGGGALQELSDRYYFSLLDLCRLMMTLSDNWATNLLIHKLGVDCINARANELGVGGLKLERSMMDVAARAKGKDNRITALEMAKLYDHLFQIRETGLLGTEMWQMLGRQQFRDKIPFFWGEEIEFHHKTGSLENIEHDGGIYVSFQGAFVIIILISNMNNAQAIQLSAEMGAHIRDFIDNRLPL